MFRIFKNRKFQNANVLQLTTIGAKTGQRRQSTVVYFPDRDNSVLIVASAGGAVQHPAWFFNIAKHPDQVRVRVGDRDFGVTPETLSGTERAAAWERIKTQSPVFAGYEIKTDRELPIIRLTPVA
ncbi:MAG: nitroreductase family deazaflavin-dependent oxidoreductase [Chloroflexi bacterium]|nr:nitroreductase family deazaflavin-dependent oxidoreductase [Chloroflexota bacterium]MBV9545828.1 nitroreductase family deazaflavin-dependent oxidoreductase [Chloroflexota bacterium]